MSKEHKELAVRPSPMRFPRRVRVLVSFAALVLTATQVQALANSFLSAESAVQSAPEVRRPQARSEQERADFKTAYALTSAASEEAAANDFAAKYPESELRHYLYSSAMLLYQRENNSAKMLAMSEKVLELDADNPLALVLTATALADGLGDHDRDRERKIGTIKRNATRAIQTAESSYASSAGDATQIYKSTLQAMAYSALGIMKLKTGDDAGAEKDLSKAADLAKIHPDPYVWYHLALAQDHRKKYAAALSSVEQALQLASSDPDLQKLAEVEHERLAGLTKGPHNGETPEPQ
jgi:tetratricopeptide (TPR) repeat protein